MADKWGQRLFIAGAIILLLAGAAHSLSLLQKPVPANDTERQLFDLAANYKFNLMGSMRSTDNMMDGFSIAFLVAMLGLGALDLSLTKAPPALLKRVALINAIWMAVMTAVSLRYFFAAPAALMGAAFLIFALAWVKLPVAAS